MPQVLGRGWRAKINPPGAPGQSPGLCVGAVIAPHPVGTSVGTLSAAHCALALCRGLCRGRGFCRGSAPQPPAWARRGPAVPRRLQPRQTLLGRDPGSPSVLEGA